MVAHGFFWLEKWVTTQFRGQRLLEAQNMPYRGNEVEICLLVARGPAHHTKRLSQLTALVFSVLAVFPGARTIKIEDMEHQCRQLALDMSELYVGVCKP
jgi:hypothetical protein